jgi:hypothetical protein
MNLYKVKLSNDVERHVLAFNMSEVEKGILSGYSPRVKIVNIELIAFDVLIAAKLPDDLGGKS